MSGSKTKKSVSKSVSVSESRTRAGLSKEMNKCMRMRPTSEAEAIAIASHNSKPIRMSSNETNSLSRPRRRISSHKDTNELHDTIKALQSQLVTFKSELDKAHAINAKLASDLAAAQAKIATLTLTPHQEAAIGEYVSPKFKDIQKLIANKLELKKEPIHEPTTIVMRTPSSSLPSPISQSPKVSAVQNKSPPPPPPPPLPLPPRLARAPTNQKAPAFLELKQELKRDSPALGRTGHNKHLTIAAHSSIVGEIQNRSAHLLAIKADIQTKGDLINGLIIKVLATEYADIEDVLKFVDWLDGQLSSLADERAVLKHFNWPEKKADALREAAIEYRELKLLESEISSYKYDIDLPCSAALKKMANLLDKSERSIQRLVKLRSAVLHSYQKLKIPTDWMIDSGIMSKIKQASLNVVKTFMKKVTVELESIKNSDRESLVLQGVNLAYRAHQFAGGLDSETLCAFEEIRHRFSGILLPAAAIPSS